MNGLTSHCNSDSPSILPTRRISSPLVRSSMTPPQKSSTADGQSMRAPLARAASVVTKPLRAVGEDRLTWTGRRRLPRMPTTDRCTQISPRDSVTRFALNEYPLTDMV